MNSSHILALIGALSFTVIGCGGGSSYQGDMSSLEQEMDSRKWTFEPKSLSEIKYGDQVTAVFSGGSKQPVCSTLANEFKVINSIEEDGKIKFIFKFEPDNSITPNPNYIYEINCSTKEAFNFAAGGASAGYKYKKT